MNNKKKYCKKGSLNYQKIESAGKFLKIISAKNRLRIICLLEESKEKCVCEISDYLELPQNLISHHLKVLTDNEILISERRKLNIYYKLNQETINKYKKLINQFL